jgi:Fic family protein
VTERRSSTQTTDEEDLLILNEDEVALQEAINGLLQFDEVIHLTEVFSPQKKLVFTPDLLLRLNLLAIQGIRRSAGFLRTVPITITNTAHQPPPAEEVEHHVQEMCAYVNSHWQSKSDDLEDALHISAYLMWRLNWIHPFRDGNGRTSRAISYLALGVRAGSVLPGSPTIPDLIVSNKEPYYYAIDAADAAWKSGGLDVTEMENLIRRLLIAQLSSEEGDMTD